jgi:enterochelin esterase family protein
LAQPPQSCFLDGIQAATGATTGKRTLNWEQADKLVVRVRNIRNGKTVELQPTPVLLGLLASFKPDAKAGAGHGPGQHDHEQLEQIARKIAAMPNDEIAKVTILDETPARDTREQSSLAPPASSEAPATSQSLEYLIFWSDPEKAGELAERVGMKGDGKTRLLGFGLPISTYEIEEQLPSRIRSAFAAARRHNLAVMLQFDFHLAWKNRPDLWNWFDPDKLGYDPNNKYNVEWHGWDGPPNKVRYLNWGVLERLPPNMCFTSKRTRAEVTRIVSRTIGPVLREQIGKLKAEGKEALFAGVLVGSEPSIDDYSKADSECTKMMKEDGVPAGPLGYRALLDRGFSADKPPDDFRKALAKIVQETIAFWCEQFVDAGIPAEKLYPHVAAPAPIEMMNAPIWTAFNKYSRPGWTTYAVGVLGESFKPIYDELEKRGNPTWAGVEANAGIPGSVVDWETYLAWHYNHGCVLVGLNTGATGKDLPKRLSDSAFGAEAIAAYRKFLMGRPLVEKAVSLDRPEFRIQAKMKRVRAGVERWHSSGKDPSAIGKLMESAQPLADAGKLRELEKLVDQALEMLGDTVRADDQEHKLGPDSMRHEGVPNGTVTKDVWHSKVFPGTVRDYWVYVPAQYDGKKPACVMVFQDGQAYVDENGDFRVSVVFDNLIHKGEMPLTIAIFINPGQAGEQPSKGPREASNRSFEYDSLSDQYARFLLEEILPEVGKWYKLTDDPECRAICGISSGGICAFTVAWQRPDAFRKVLSHVGSFANIRGGHVYPSLIRTTPNKPIRVFLQDGSGDLDNERGNWWLANQEMAAALKFRGYDYKFVGGTGTHSGKHGGAILPDSLRWLWRDVELYRHPK